MIALLLAVAFAAPASPTSCHYRFSGALPDPACTPGANDPRIRQTIDDSFNQASKERTRAIICAAGYSSSVRPPSSYTSKLKREQMKAYGATGPTSAYQEDHLIPLSLGGAPRDPANLWPMPIRYALRKDVAEHAMLRLVCTGVVTLWAARGLFAVDWRAAARLAAFAKTHP